MNSERDWRKYAFIAMQAIAAIVAVFSVVNYFGLNFLCERMCSEVSDRWYAPFFTLGALTLSVTGISLAVKNNFEWTKWTALVQALCAIIAFTILIVTEAACGMCFTIQFMWIASSFLTIKSKWWSLLTVPFLAISLLSLSEQVKDQVSQPVGNMTLLGRVYEPKLRGAPNSFILFSDPLCPACIRKKATVNDEALPLPLLYRWKLLSSTGKNSVTIASTFETCLRTDYEKGKTAISLYYKKMNEIDSKEHIASWHEVLYSSCVESGFDQEWISEIISTPDQESLQAISDDAKLAKSLRIESVPTLGRGDYIPGLDRNNKVLVVDSVISIDNYSADRDWNLEPLKIFCSDYKKEK